MSTSFIPFKSFCDMNNSTLFKCMSDMDFWNRFSRCSSRAFVKRSSAWKPMLVNRMLQRCFNSFSWISVQHVRFKVRIKSAAVVWSAIFMSLLSLCLGTNLLGSGKSSLTESRWDTCTAATKTWRNAYYPLRMEKVVYSTDGINCFLSAALYWLRYLQPFFLFEQTDCRQVHSPAGSKAAAWIGRHGTQFETLSSSY